MDLHPRATQLARDLADVAAVVDEQAPQIVAPDTRLARRIRRRRARRRHALLWDGARETPLAGHSTWVWRLAFSGDGRLLATGSVDQTIRVWDADTATEQGAPLDAQAGTILSLAVTRDGKAVASAHTNGEVRIWDLATRRSSLLARVHGGAVIALSPDEQLVAIGTGDGVVLAPIDGGPSRSLGPVGVRVMAVRFSADGKRLATGASNGRVLVWDLTTGAMRELAKRDGRVGAIAFSNDGRHVAASSGAGDVGLWNLEDGTGGTLAGHVGEVTTLAFAPDGLVTGGFDGTVRLWALDGRFRSLREATARSMRSRSPATP